MKDLEWFGNLKKLLLEISANLLKSFNVIVIIIFTALPAVIALLMFIFKTFLTYLL